LRQTIISEISDILGSDYLFAQFFAKFFGPIGFADTLCECGVAMAQSENPDTLHGSCLCGKVTYVLNGPGQFMYYCHCSQCRRASGSSFATNLLVAKDDFVVTSGENFLKRFESSPNEYRNFCSECGSPIYGDAKTREGVVSIRCGTLLEDPSIRPKAHYYSHSKAPWTEIQDDLRRVPE